MHDDRWNLPESQTTTVPVAFSCSREEDIMWMDVGKMDGRDGLEKR
jgi:hypothetical protein